MMNPLFLPKP